MSSPFLKTLLASAARGRKNYKRCRRAAGPEPKGGSRCSLCFQALTQSTDRHPPRPVGGEGPGSQTIQYSRSEATPDKPRTYRRRGRGEAGHAPSPLVEPDVQIPKIRLSPRLLPPARTGRPREGITTCSSPSGSSGHRPSCPGKAGRIVGCATHLRITRLCRRLGSAIAAATALASRLGTFLVWGDGGRR
jgi:hypothetical protein